MFKHLVNSTKDKITDKLINGTTIADLVSLVAVAEKWTVKRKVGFVGHFAPFLKKNALTTKGFAADIKEILESTGGAIIVGMSHIDDDNSHWTVISRVTKNKFVLMDSSGMDEVSFDDVTLSGCAPVTIHPECTIILSPKHKYTMTEKQK